MSYWDRAPNTDLSQTQAFLDRFIAGDPNRRYEFILIRTTSASAKPGYGTRPRLDTSSTPVIGDRVT